MTATVYEHGLGLEIGMVHNRINENTNDDDEYP
jgi:hypothetical protein